MRLVAPGGTDLVLVVSKGLSAECPVSRFDPDCQHATSLTRSPGYTGRYPRTPSMRNGFLTGVAVGALLLFAIAYGVPAAQTLTETYEGEGEGVDEHQHANVTFDIEYIEPYNACAVVPDVEWNDDEEILATSFMYGDNGTIVDNGTEIKYLTADEEITRLKLHLDGTVRHDGETCWVDHGRTR